MHSETHRTVERYLKDRRTSGALARSTLADYGYVLHGLVAVGTIAMRQRGPGAIGVTGGRNSDQMRISE